MQHDYFGFIASAYGISAIALAGLGFWVFIDARTQRRALQDLEARGVRRRSSRQVESSGSAGSAMTRAAR